MEAVSGRRLARIPAPLPGSGCRSRRRKHARSAWRGESARNNWGNHDMTAVADAGSSPTEPTRTDERRPSIAVVDDDSGFAGYLRTFLALRGYEARSYTRGDEIVAAIRQGEPP